MPSIFYDHNKMKLSITNESKHNKMWRCQTVHPSTNNGSKVELWWKLDNTVCQMKLKAWNIEILRYIGSSIKKQVSSWNMQINKEERFESII